MMLRVFSALGIILLAAMLQLLFALQGSVALLLGAGFGIGLLLPLGIRFLQTASAGQKLDLYWPSFCTVVGIFLGNLLGEQIKPSTSFVASGVAVLLGAVGSGIAIAYLHRKHSSACQICHRPLAREQRSCPRCHHVVCAQTNCWNAEYGRCADCHWLRRPLLALEEEAWWLRRLGAQVTVGKCIRCEKSAQATDLRKCGQCPRSMCVQCWDQENGRCLRCRWVLPDLPEDLQQFWQEELPVPSQTGDFIS